MKKLVVCMMSVFLCSFACSQDVFSLLDQKKYDDFCTYIKSGKNIHVKNSMGSNALMVAAYTGKEYCEALLQTKKIDVNEKRDDGMTALMCAAGWGDTDTVRYLIEKGAEVNTVTSDGYTAFRLAVDHGKIDNIKELITHDVDYSVTDRYQGDTAMTSIAFNPAENGLLEFLVQNKCGIHDRDSDDMSPLDIAVMNNNVEGVRILIAGGADVNGKFGNGEWSILEFTQKSPNAMKYKRIEQMLVEAGAK